MLRPTAPAPLFSVLKTGFAAIIALTAIVACGDYGTSAVATPSGITRVKVDFIGMDVPDSVKERMSAEAAAGSASAVPFASFANVVSPAFNLSSAAACGGGGFQGYKSSRIPFTPEAIPMTAPYPVGDEGYIPDVRLGFNFSFEGNTYDRVNVFSNGFLQFGATVPGKWFPDAMSLPDGSRFSPRNMIGFAWTDWDPSKVADPIRYETRGSAPNRIFVIQYNNVPEYKGQGLLTSQVVLFEGSNDIAIYTNRMNTTVGNGRFVTQAIQNVDGTNATFDSVTNTAGVWTSRNRNVFRLENDAVRFSLIQSKDEQAPTITQPENLTAFNDPGLASAVVVVAPPATSDNCGSATVSGVRGDGKALTDPYPVGVTTITWTAKDEAKNASSLTQTVTVIDNEAPVFAPTTWSVLQVNATSPSGAVASWDLRVTDNVGVTSVVCEPASGSVFPVGSNAVTCTASDAAANSSVKAFNVEVIDAHQQLFNLIAYVRALNLPNGTAQPLINQLEAAYGNESGDQACKKLGDFLSMVQKKDANIPAGQAAFISGEASRIVSAMGCPPPKRATIGIAPTFQRFSMSRQ